MGGNSGRKSVLQRPGRITPPPKKTKTEKPLSTPERIAAAINEADSVLLLPGTPDSVLLLRKVETSIARFLQNDPSSDGEFQRSRDDMFQFTDVEALADTEIRSLVAQHNRIVKLQKILEGKLDNVKKHIDSLLVAADVTEIGVGMVKVERYRKHSVSRSKESLLAAGVSPAQIDRATKDVWNWSLRFVTKQEKE